LWLVVVTAVRRSELCGLQICDVDLDRALVHIAVSYVVCGGRRVRKTTKPGGLKTYVANTAVSRPGRLWRIHSFFRARLPDQIPATGAGPAHGCRRL
jgi:integrase